MLVPSSDSKYFWSVIYYWNKIIMISCQVMKSAQWICAQMKLKLIRSSEWKYVNLSNGLIQSFEICYTFRVSICSGHCGENVTPVHCSAVVCNYILPYFLYLKQCVVISKFGSTVLSGLKKRQGLQWTSHCLMYTLTVLHEMFHPQCDPFHPIVP